jgi:hypothetical protein
VNACSFAAARLLPAVGEISGSVHYGVRGCENQNKTTSVVSVERERFCSVRRESNRINPTRVQGDADRDEARARSSTQRDASRKVRLLRFGSYRLVHQRILFVVVIGVRTSLDLVSLLRTCLWLCSAVSGTVLSYPGQTRIDPLPAGYRRYTVVATLLSEKKNRSFTHLRNHELTETSVLVYHIHPFFFLSRIRHSNSFARLSLSCVCAQVRRSRS